MNSPFVIILLLGAPIAAGLWLIFSVLRANKRIFDLSRRLESLETELLRRRQKLETSPVESAAPPVSRFESLPVLETAPQVPPPIAPEPFSTPPPLTFSDPPPGIRFPELPASRNSAVNWEQFMGVKLFAWLGGLALFLGLTFFVKYSFDNNLISPALRVVIGFATGIALVSGGVVMSRRNHSALSQTLCATGVVILYAITFACRSVYHFQFFGPGTTFFLMGVITTAAFFLAARLGAMVVAILGLLGGFLTPILLASGQDSPLALFGYIAILDAGLILIALRCRWDFLPALAAVGTVLMQTGWILKFFVARRYFAGNRVLIPFAVLLAFNVLYFAGGWAAKRRRPSNGWLTGSTFGLSVVALAFTFFFLGYPELAARPWLVFGFVFLVDMVVTALSVIEEGIAIGQSIAGMLIFGLLGWWTIQSLENVLLNAALAFYFIFALFHCAFPILRKGKAAGRLESRADDSIPAAPVLFAVLPFLLLVLTTLHLPLSNPSPIFGLALLLVIQLLGLGRLFALEALSAVALACVAGLEWAWHVDHFEGASAVLPLTWYIVFFAVFSVFPFLFLKKLSNEAIPWGTAAMAGPIQFFLIQRLVASAYPNHFMGLLALAFAIPALACLFTLINKIPVDSPARLAQLAWFGGAVLFFITLIFPLQFERQWITIGWALEGAALLWLFQRVPHPGLRLAGAGLLVIAFARLSLNSAVLGYHPRSAAPILNWYLYTYCLVTISLFAGARLLAPPREQIGQINVPPILAAMGTTLLFLLLNIEIADFFSEPGSTLTFQFSGNFARDMTYSIAWALFALLLLLIGILKKVSGARYAAVALLSLTLLKLFFHDLAQLGPIYRIGAFIGVAVTAMLASFAYQRFYAAPTEAPDR